ncbi:MAG TPA: hypothetical protein VHY31_23600 [Streptosporangiaceae bacterium]|nr:hypothetical protein [Streptosporangiaceae bacterium]
MTGMLRLGLRLTLDGGREAAARLIITAVAVALDVGLLLTTLASIDALRAQNARAAWLNTGSGRRHTPGRATRIAGPWLTMAGSRAMARRAGRPAVLTAGRRLEDSPRAAFRAVSGLILALFATCVAVGVITTSVDSQRPSSGTVASDTLVDHFYAVTAGRTVTSVASFPGAALQRLRSVRGVRGMAVIYAGPGPGAGAGTGPRVVSVSPDWSRAHSSRAPGPPAAARPGPASRRSGWTWPSRRRRWLPVPGPRSRCRRVG